LLNAVLPVKVRMPKIITMIPDARRKIWKGLIVLECELQT